LVYSSAITMMHGPINIRCYTNSKWRSSSALKLWTALNTY